MEILWLFLLLQALLAAPSFAIPAYDCNKIEKIRTFRTQVQNCDNIQDHQTYEKPVPVEVQVVTESDNLEVKGKQCHVRLTQVCRQCD